MFQYAAGRALAYRLNSNLLIDTSYLDQDPKGSWTKRDFELDIFNITGRKAIENELSEFHKISKSRFKRKIGKLFPFVFGKNVYFKEYGYSFHPEIEKLKGNIYLDGFWQSHKYFSDRRDLILKEFSFLSVPDERNAALLTEIDGCNSISIHVRRTDYVSNKNVQDYHGICSVDYYKTAVEKLAKGLSNVQLFMFSDEPDWVKENLFFDLPTTIISHNTGRKSYEDLRLMSHCKFNVTANSSFSWWAAWMNNFSDKKVIAPKNWFADKTINTSDLCPPEWIRL